MLVAALNVVYTYGAPLVTDVPLDKEIALTVLNVIDWLAPPVNLAH